MGVSMNENVETGAKCGFGFEIADAKEMNERFLGGTKHDKEKVQLDLLSSAWIMGVGDVLTFGAKKYAAHNWRKGIKLSRLLGACLRHIFAFLKGEDKDPETGISHLYHASCCLMFASELHETMPDIVDDRYKVKNMEALSIQEEIAKKASELKTKNELENISNALREAEEANMKYLARQKEMMRG